MSASSRVRIIAAGVGAALMLGSPPAPAQAPERPNLLLVTVDTLRADHLTVYDPDSPATTPTLDALAAGGVLFEDASTTNPLTTPAHASLLTGSWPLRHGVRDFAGYRLAEEEVTLAETLQKAGYATAAFVGAAVLDRRTGMAQGFDTYGDDFEGFLGGDSSVAERPGREVLARARQWLESAPRPFFLWVHLYEPHDPYTPPPEFLRRSPGSPYAGEVAYTDALLGEFFSELKERRLWDSTLVSVLSDHGEGLGEHGESRHGFFVYQSTIRIPWIVRFPGDRYAGHRVPEPASIVDVFPTLLHALGIDRAQWPADLQGRSRFSAIRGTGSAGAPVYFESMTPQFQFGWSALRGWRQGRFKYIEAPGPELYDLEADPTEQTNLLGDDRSLAANLSRQLEQFQASFQLQRAVAVGVDPRLQEQLRSLGYVGVSSALTEAPPDAADPKDKVASYELMQSGVEAARGRRWSEALADLEKAAAAEPESPAILTSLALASRDAGRHEQAVETFEKLFRLTPHDLPLRLEYARYLIALRRPEPARLQLEAILRRDPHHFLALFNLGTLEGQQGNLEAAAGYFRRAVAVQADPGALSSLALAESYLGRFAEAERHLLRALEVEPGNRRAHAQLAEVYERLGRQEDAQRHRRLARPE